MTVLATPVTGSEGSRLRRVRPHLLLAGGVLLASLALHLRDPHEGGSWGFCPWLVTTGTYCPGCGGLRAVNDLTHGDLAAAASSNLMFVAALPGLAMLWARGLVQQWRGRSRPLPRWWVVGASASALVAVAVFWTLRNLPAGAWLAP
jgi:hypothetical protein